MRYLSFILCVCFSGILWTQNEIQSGVNYLNHDPFYEKDSGYSDPVLPVLGNTQTIAKRWSWFNQKEKNKGNYFSIFPVLNTFGTHQNDFTNVSIFNIGTGIGFETQLTSKFYSRILLPANTQFQLSPYSKDEVNISLQPAIRLSYSPYSFLNIQAGIDQNFIGFGNRSILLSDYGTAYPFVQLRTNIWKINILNLYQFFEEKKGSNKVLKYASTHFFNYNVTKRWQIGIFESVVFAPKDTLLNRVYELDYLNPFLFYRPTEYTLGSQDRLLIGLNTAFELNNLMIYGQFAIDDFVLHEILKKTRWWANKYGGQIGVKGKKTLKNNQQLRWLIELNAARPFMYSHADINTVYGNKGQALAHPTGSNFAEFFVETSISFNSGLTLKGQSFFVQQGGFDGNDKISYGNNIYQPYNNRPFEYGYKIGGNGQINRLNFSIEGDYLISEKLNLIAFIRPAIELNNRYTEQFKSYFSFFAGIRSNLWNERRFSF